MKQALFRLAGTMALLAVGQAQAAEPKAAPPRPCITDAEVHGLVGYFLPNVLQEVTGKCAAFLPAEAYLRRGMPGLIERLQAGREAAWPQARTGFFKFAPNERDIRAAKLSDAQLREVVDQVLAREISIPMTADVCGEVNDIAEAMAPLDPQQTIHLVAAILNTAGRKAKSLNTCPRQG
ncbi:MAG: hypothetical protein QM676_07010 [Novosphingobium sp.]